jgi:hypothetical protein
MNQVHFRGNESSYELQKLFQELFDYRLLLGNLIKKKSGVGRFRVYRILFNLMKDIDRKITKKSLPELNKYYYLIN